MSAAVQDASSTEISTNLNPRCIASTGTDFKKPIVKRDGALKAPGRNHHESNFFHSAQFSGDGTTIITHNEDQHLRTFVLPHDLLDSTTQPNNLASTSAFASASNIQSFTLYPGYQLHDPTTTLALCARAGVPIYLRNVLAWDVVHASYILIDANTEAYLSARSLKFSPSGTHFIVGGDNRIAIFDCSRDGSGPTSVKPLRPSREARRRGFGVGAAECHGLVSSMDISSENGMLAVGTLARQIGLYEHEGAGECTAGFSVALEKSEHADFGGTGVSQVQWSGCGRFLFVAERQSTVVQVFDVRNTYSRLAILTGRKGRTPQRLGFDVVQTASGSELWAGGTDGTVCMWSRPGEKEGHVDTEFCFAAGAAPISSTIWHPSGAILATCSGTRLPLTTRPGESNDSASDADDTEDSDHEVPAAYDDAGALDNVLKVWTI